MKHRLCLLSSVLAFIIYPFIGFTQKIIIGNGTQSNLTSPISINKSTPTRYARSASVYKSSELISAGGSAGFIRNIAWYRALPSGPLHPNNNGKLKVYLKGVSFATFDSSSKSWMNLKNNSTAVYDEETVNFGTEAGWKELSFSNAFSWNGIDNVLVLVEWENADTSESTIAWRYVPTSSSNVSASSNNLQSMSTLTRNSNRPDVRFGLSSSLRDVQLLDVLVDKGNCVGSQSAIQMKIRNNSDSTITSLSINWSINGIPQAMQTFNAPLLPATETLLNIGQLNFDSNLPKNLSVWVHSVNNLNDQRNTNDTIWKQVYPSLNGIYNVSVNGHFKNMQEVISAINERGICAGVIFNFDSTAGPYTGIYNLYNFNSLNNNFNVTFNGNGTILNTNTLVSPTYNQRAFFYLNGVKNLKLNGFNFKNLGTYSSGACIRLNDSCENIQITNNSFSHLIAGKGNSIEMNGYSGDFVIYPVQIKNILISQNKFDGPQKALQVEGFVGKAIDVKILKNSFINFTQNGIDISNLLDASIDQNTFSSSRNFTVTTQAAVSGIVMNGVCDGSIIKGNGFSNILLPTNYQNQDVRVIYFYVAQGIKAYNNLIFNATEKSSRYYAIYMYNSSNLSIEHNTISSGKDRNLTSEFIGIYNYLTKNSTIQNNIINYSSGGANFKALMYHVGPPDSTIKSNYNLFYISPNIGTQNIIIKSSTGNYSSLASWKQNTASNLEQNSLEGNPFFYNENGMNYTPISAIANNVGFPIPYITDDFYKLSRNTLTPDLGAFEYDSKLIDVGLGSIEIPGTNCSQPQVININIINGGTQKMDSVKLAWSVNGVLQTGKKITSSLISGENASFILGYYPMKFDHQYQIKAWVTEVNDSAIQNTSNDTIQLNINYRAYSDTITIGGPTAHFQSINAALVALQNTGLCGTVILDVDPKFGPYNEHIIVNPISGLSAQKQLIIKGNGAVLRNPFYDNANIAVLKLNGVSFVTIDGFEIQVEHSTVGTGIQLKSNSNYNTIVNNKIILQKNTSFSGRTGIWFNGNDANTILAGLYRGNKILSNVIDGGYNAIRLTGTSANTVNDNGVIIKNNLLKNFISTAIQISDMDSIVIDNNEFHHLELNSQYIQISKVLFYSNNARNFPFSFANNNIHNLVNNETTNKEIIVLDVLSTSSSTNATFSVVNNIVYDIVSKGRFTFFQNVNFGDVNLFHNTINVKNVDVFRFVNFDASASLLRHKYYNNMVLVTKSTNIPVIYSINSSSLLNTLKIDNNYYGNLGSSSIFFSSSHSSFNSWKSQVKVDSNSIVLVNPILLPSNYIMPSNGSVLMNAGKKLVEVQTDVLGKIRSNSSPTIGAFENSMKDVTGPLISYSMLSPTTLASNRGLNNFATIVDSNSVDTSLVNAPRFYYKKRSDKNVFIENKVGVDGWKYVKAVNKKSPFSFIIDYNLLKDSSVKIGDIIEYFVFAKDTLGNTAISNYTFSNDIYRLSNIEASIPFDTAFNSYGIARTLSDTIYVGDAHPIKSLTNENGLFQYLNNNFISGKITAVITSNLNESGFHALSKTNRTGSANSFVEILSDNKADYIISGSKKFGLVRFEGADSVIVGNAKISDKKLIVRNTYASTKDSSFVFYVQGHPNSQLSSTNITFRNIRIESNTNSVNSFGILAGNPQETQDQSVDYTVKDLFIFNNDFVQNKYGISMFSALNPNPLFHHENIRIDSNRFNSDTSIVAIQINNCLHADVYSNDIYFKFSKSINPTNDKQNSGGILNSYYLGNASISNNKIIINFNEVFAAYPNIAGISIEKSKGSNRLIANNVIINNFRAYASNVIGLDLNNADSIDVYYNTVSLQGYANLNYTEGVLAFRAYLNSNLRVANNSFQNLIKGTIGSLLIHIDSTFLGDSSLFDYNHFEYYGYRLLRKRNVVYADLATLKDGLKNNMNSISGYSFSSDENATPNSALLFAKGLSIHSINKDYNNKRRALKPTIGAYELDSISNDIALVSILSPLSAIPTNTLHSVDIILANYSMSTSKPFFIKAIVNTDTITYSYLKPLDANEADTISITGFSNSVFNQAGVVKVYLENNLDQNKFNDTLSSSFCTGRIVNSLIDDDTVNVCEGNSVTISKYDLKFNRTYYWYDQPVGGNLLFVGNYFNIETPINRTLYIDNDINSRYDSLNVGKQSNTGYSGIFYTVKNTNTYSILLKSVGLFGSINSTFPNTTIKIYYKQGSFEGFESDANSWTLGYTNNYLYLTRQESFASYIPDIAIPAGQTVSFFISVSGNASKLSTVAANAGNRKLKSKGVELSFGSVKSNSLFTSTTVTDVIPQMNLYYEMPDQCVSTVRAICRINVNKGLNNAGIVPSETITQRDGDVLKPDIVCKGTDIIYNIVSPPGYTEQDYGVKWLVLEKKIYLVRTNQLYLYRTDSTRRIKIGRPNSTLNDLFKIEVVLHNIETQCNTTYVRYFYNINPQVLNLPDQLIICEGDSIQLNSGVSSVIPHLWSTGETGSSIFAKKEGYYKLTIHYGNCLSTSDSVYLTLKKSADSISINASLIQGCKYQFNAENLNYPIVWNFGDGSTSTQQNPVHQYAENGVYKVQLVVKDTSINCIAKDTSALIINNTCFVGLENVSDEMISIAPNPFSGVLKLNLYNDKDALVSVRVYNMLGQLVDHVRKEQMEKPNAEIIWTNSYPKGVYTVEITIGNKQYVKKVLKLD